MECTNIKIKEMYYNMDWKPDRNAKRPIYKQIAEYIENGIDDGTFPLDQTITF